ncbi:hypothetical protein J3B02_002866 [Coemansia erecta]|nr:hypothetical protein J3B02_002866 [Coemansia erecta]
MDSRKNIESRAFPDAYKPSLQLLDEDGDDFDFDNLLQSAAKGGAMGSNANMYDALSPDAPKRTDFAYGDTGASLDSLAASISPMEFLKTPATAVNADPRGSDKPGDSRLAQAREELLSSLPTAGSPPPAMQSQAQPYAARRIPSEANVTSKGNVSSLQTDLMQKLALNDAGLNSLKTPHAHSLPVHDNSQQPWSATPSSSESEFSLSMQPSSSNLSQLSSPSTPVAAALPGYQRNNSLARLQTNHKPPVSIQGTTSINGHRKTGSIANNAEGRSMGIGSSTTNTTNGSVGREGGLSIGSIMRTHSSKVDSRTSPASPSSPTAFSNGSGKSTAANVDTQIRISSRKTNLTRSPSDSTTASPTPTYVQAFGGSGLSDSPERKLMRNATAPSAMSNAAKPLASSLGTSGPSSVPKALGELASLMGGIPGGGKTAAANGALPGINTKLASGGNARGMANPLGLSPSLSHSTATSRVPSLQRSGNSGGRGLKSAKLDSLLDDLMGEMQALSAEVRTESDRDSVVSSVSGNGGRAEMPNSPVEAASRGRLDSSVSTASTSSTLSVGNVHKRVHCATCGTGISASSKGAIVPASRLTRSNEVPPGVQAVEVQGRAYCVRDYRRAHPLVCASCQQPCEVSRETSVHALDAWWHRGCFNCQECRRPFPDKSFYVFEQRPYCRYDYHKLNNSLCAACEDPIEGPCAQVYEGRFHPKCFSCNYCGEPLRDVYYSLEGRFLCEKHVHQQKSHKNANKRQTVFGHI